MNHSIFPWSRDRYGPPFDQMSCFHLSQKVDGITKCFIQKTKNKHESDLSGRWDHEKLWQSRRLFKRGITLSESTKMFFQKYLLFRLLRNPGWQLCHSQIIFWCDHCTKGFNQTATHALWICLSWQAGLRFGMASQMLKGVLGLKSLIWAMQKVKMKISNGSKMLISLIFPSDLRGLDIILLRMFFFRPPRLSHRWAWAVGLTRYRCRITSLTIETQICSTNLPQITHKWRKFNAHPDIVDIPSGLSMPGFLLRRPPPSQSFLEYGSQDGTVDWYTLSKPRYIQVHPLWWSNMATEPCFIWHLPGKMRISITL